MQIYARVIFNGKLAKSLAHRPGPGIIEGSSFARFDHFFCTLLILKLSDKGKQRAQTRNSSTQRPKLHILSTDHMNSISEEVAL